MAATEATYAEPTRAVARRRSGLGRIAPSSRWYWLRLLLENPAAMISVIVLLLLILVAIFAPLLAPSDPTFLNPAIQLLGPSRAHLFGTDDLGRDVLSRAIYGGRVSLAIGFSVTVVAALLGSVLGLISGYYDRLDAPIMRVMDGLMAFPSLLLAIALMASLGPSAVNVFIALVVVSVPTVARIVRGSTLSLRHQPYVESARAIGLRDYAILRRYIFANAISPLIVQCTYIIAISIITEASLSFLGAGVPPETPTWGNMLQDGQRVLQQAWWVSVFPGIALVLTVLTLNLLGDGLRDALDPRTRER
jgi:peptide/nickel transport system permease protein